MGLKDLKDGNIDPTSSSSSGGSSSSSSGSGSGSSYDSLIPTFAIWTDEDGEYQSGWNPQHLPLEYKDGDLNAIPAEIERFWIEQMEFKRIIQMVEEEFDVDALGVLLDRPERGIKLVRKAAKRHSPQDIDWEKERCAVCKEDLHVRYDDYEVVDRRRVCSHHTVTELKDHDMI